MPRVHVGPDDKQIVMRGSETILAASLREGIPHAYACGGRARCSICRISVEKGLEFCSPRSKGERTVAERLNFGPETRLACQTKITGDVKVRRLVVDDDDIEFTRGIAGGPRPASIGEEKKLTILFADVRGFTLRRPGGELVEFSLRELQNGTEFPPGHLAEHRATAEPILVIFRTQDDERLATRLEDAPR